MKDKLITQITTDMAKHLSLQQLENLQKVLMATFINVEVAEIKTVNEQKSNEKLLELFISAKRIEGCSEKSLKYYRMVIENMFVSLKTSIRDLTTSDLRTYLARYQQERKSSKVTIENMRRIFSSFFGWLEDEDYILKSPVRRIHKIKTDKTIKETLSDEGLELLRDACDKIRDLALTGATTGKIGVIPKNFKGYVNQRVGLFYAKTELSYAVLWSILQQQNIITDLIKLSSGSAQANLSPFSVNSYDLNVTFKDLIELDKVLSPLYELFCFNLSEIQRLSKLRDTLLPKLLSGELSVNQAIK